MLLIAMALAMQSPPVDQADRAAVVDAENGWEAAEVSGDVSFLNELLVDDYQSVSAEDRAYYKKDIIAGAIRQAKANPSAVAAKLDASSIITIYGDTAVVQHHGHSQISVDLLQRRGGKWRAWYSQHTMMAAPKQ